MTTILDEEWPVEGGCVWAVWNELKKTQRPITVNIDIVLLVVYVRGGDL